MVWGALSFNNDNTDIYFDLTCPLNSIIRRFLINNNILNQRYYFLDKAFDEQKDLDLDQKPLLIVVKFLKLLIIIFL